MSKPVERRCFVKLPDYKIVPLDEAKKSVKVIDESELDVTEIDHFLIPLIHLSKLYSEDSNPFYALKAFNHSITHGYYPSKWVLDWLFDAFNEFMKSEGSLSIDRCLGLQGRNKSTAMHKANKRTVEYWLSSLIEILVNVFGKSVFDAAEMVHQLACKTDDCSNPGRKITGYSAETLEQYYMSKWKKYRDQDRVHRYLSWDEKDKSEFLKQFAI